MIDNIPVDECPEELAFDSANGDVNVTRGGVADSVSNRWFNK